MKKHLEYKDEKSHKFWQIEVNGNSFTVTYGKVGTKGQSKTKEFDTNEKALVEAEKLIKQKIKKGYKEKGETEDELYGIDKDYAHQKAIDLIPEEFFWSCGDELAPFGSDEGDTALSEFRDWKKRHPNKETYECLKWTIEGVSEKSISEYNEKILDVALIKSQLDDTSFNDQQYIYTVDISVIATGFGQLVDEGKIDLKNKPLIKLAIDRQKIWAELASSWVHRSEYINNLNVLDRVLKAI